MWHSFLPLILGGGEKEKLMDDKTLGLIERIAIAQERQAAALEKMAASGAVEV